MLKSTACAAARRAVRDLRQFRNIAPSAAKMDSAAEIISFFLFLEFDLARSRMHHIPYARHLLVQVQ